MNFYLNVVAKKQALHQPAPVFLVGKVLTNNKFSCNIRLAACVGDPVEIQACGKEILINVNGILLTVAFLQDSSGDIENLIINR